MKEVEFTINTQTGEMQTELNGFVGRACDQAVEEIKKVLGSPQEEKAKPEYHIRTKVNNTRRIQGKR